MFLALADSKTPDKKHPSSSTTHQACLVDIPALVRLVDIKEIELQGKNHKRSPNPNVDAGSVRAFKF